MFLMDKDEKLFNCFVGRFGLIKAWVSIMTPERIEQYFKKKPEDKNLRFESAILWSFPEMANKNVSTESVVALCIDASRSYTVIRTWRRYLQGVISVE